MKQTESDPETREQSGTHVSDQSRNTGSWKVKSGKAVEPMPHARLHK